MSRPSETRPLFTPALLLLDKCLAHSRLGCDFETWEQTTMAWVTSLLIQTRTGVSRLGASSIWQLFANSAIAHLSSCGINCSTSHVNVHLFPYLDKVAPMFEPPDALPLIFLPRLDHQSPQLVCARAELHCQLNEKPTRAALTAVSSTFSKSINVVDAPIQHTPSAQCSPLPPGLDDFNQSPARRSQRACSACKPRYNVAACSMSSVVKY